MAEFTHGPHCVPQEDYARLMELMNRARAMNRELVGLLRASNKELAEVKDLLNQLMMGGSDGQHL